MFYKVTLGLTTGATYNMTNVHVFKAAQARRAYFQYTERAGLGLGLRIYIHIFASSYSLVILCRKNLTGTGGTLSVLLVRDFLPRITLCTKNLCIFAMRLVKPFS